MIVRIQKLQKILKQKGLNGFIVTNFFNIFYLCGFRGVLPAEREAVLIVLPSKSILVTARLYQNEAARLTNRNLKIKIIGQRSQILKSIGELLLTAKNVGFEGNDLKYGEFKEFKKTLKGTKLIPFKHLVEGLRAMKSHDELSKIEKAQKISQDAFEELVKTIKVGQIEAEIAEKLAKIIKNLGGQGLAFESIVASGANAALPHYITGRKKIKKGEVLLLDFGAKFKDYCADFTRTIFIGNVCSQYRNIYNHVYNTQKLSIGKITHGHSASAVYRTANARFKRHKLDDYFLHSLGHGVGLEVHEKPSLSVKSKDKFYEGMVFSVEPGLYFPWGAVRIEDLATVKNGHAKIIGKKSLFIEIKG